MIEYKYIINDELYCEVEFYASNPLDFDSLIEKYLEIFSASLDNKNKKFLMIRKGDIFDNYLMQLKVINKTLGYLQEKNYKNKMAFCSEKIILKPIADVSEDLISTYDINAKLFIDCKKARDWLHLE